MAHNSKKLSRDQKRKKKLAKRRRPPQLIQPYEGNKYKSAHYTEALMKAEIGIYESFVMTERSLTDRQVERSLDYLIRVLRGEKPEAPPASNPLVSLGGADEDMVAWRIQENWDDLFSTRPRHSSSDLAGILRTLLSSIQCWSRPGPDSQGYLKYIEGFLGKLGVNVRALPAAGKSFDDDDEMLDDDESAEEDLRELGETWLETGDPRAKEEFFEEARALLDEGQPGVVLEVCQWLIGKADQPHAIQAEVESLLKAAWVQEPPHPSKPKRIAGPSEPGPISRLKSFAGKLLPHHPGGRTSGPELNRPGEET